jgi:5-methylcytosine-specific restriction endonuclease McrA
VAKLNWFKFYPRDWYADAKLATTAASTQGVWINFLAAMFIEEIPEVRGTLEELSRLGRCTLPDMRQFVADAKRTRFCDYSVQGQIHIIRSRRFSREFDKTVQARERVRRFREKGGGNPERWVAIRVHILERDHYTCGYCRRKATTVDHVHPRSKGGNEASWNLVACCKKCNMVKNDRSIEEAGLTLHSDIAALLASLKANANGDANSKLTLSDSDSVSSDSGYGSLPPEEEPEFDDFYDSYPRHIGRETAIKAWDRLSYAEQQAALADLPKRKTAWERSGTDPQFIPHPSTWLNQRRWTDEMPQPINRNGTNHRGSTSVDIAATLVAEAEARAARGEAK